ncbi:MAG: hypothetical protein Q9187_001437, partial [Circinaria calcarea]
MNTWGILWLASLVIFNDGRNVFRRIERQGIVQADIATENKSLPHKEDYPQNGVPKGQQLRARARASAKPASTKASNVLTQGNVGKTEEDGATSHYAWQYLPHKFSNRIDWVYDLVTNFRGTGWSHQITSIPAPPPSVLQDIESTEFPAKSSPVSSTGNVRYCEPISLLRHRLMAVILGYLAIDAIKIIMMLDPYFWGLTSSAPPNYLPTVITSSAVLTRTYRLLLSLAGTYTALNSIFSLGPVAFVGIVGPRILGVRAEAWQYPDTYGSYRTVFTKGLAGWWGGWWHQTFRFGFEAPTKWLCQKLGWDHRSTKGKTL